MAKEHIEEAEAREDELFNRSVRGIRYGDPDGYAKRRRRQDSMQIRRAKNLPWLLTKERDQNDSIVGICFRTKYNPGNSYNNRLATYILR